MPTLLQWEYEGGEDGSTSAMKRGTQRAYAGDLVHDDAISLIIPVDTSECERIFSLMNDLKTELRSRMNQTTLRNLMAWHLAAKDLKITFEQVPFMAILHEFRELSGIRGRKLHRGTEPPKYDFRVKEELE